MTDIQSTPAVKMQHLYRMYDADGVLLYIGISKSAIARLTQHLDAQPWADEIVDTKIERHAVSRFEMEQIERAAIIAEKPKYNVIHNRQSAQTPSPAVKGWRCAICRRPAYYIQTDFSEQWQAVCKTHDTLGDRARYWFTVDRANTREKVEQWEDHLKHKNWFDWSNWNQMLRKSAPHLAPKPAKVSKLPLGRSVIMAVGACGDLPITWQVNEADGRCVLLARPGYLLHHDDLGWGEVVSITEGGKWLTEINFGIGEGVHRFSLADPALREQRMNEWVDIEHLEIRDDFGHLMVGSYCNHWHYGHGSVIQREGQMRFLVRFQGDTEEWIDRTDPQVVRWGR